MTEPNPSALKHLFGPAMLKRMASSLSKVWPAFESKKFLLLRSELEALEMKARVRSVRDELYRQLPSSYPKALKILLDSVREGGVKGFDLWPYTEFIQSYGLSSSKLSLSALREITPTFTGEWAIRPFLSQDPKATLAFLECCAKDSNVHVRRWASEGSRPRLPWGERLHEFIKHPEATENLLEILKFDPELYVRKSVSNHLNDISKDHPDHVIKTLLRWKNEATSEDAQKIDWTIHRSLRTLIKNGHPGAMKLIGVGAAPKIEFEGFRIAKNKICLGESLDFEFSLRSTSKKPQKIVIDYIVHFRKANATLSPKVFKLRTLEILGGSEHRFQKSHPCKQITTRRYYAGRQSLEIQINGMPLGKMDWSLSLSSSV